MTSEVFFWGLLKFFFWTSEVFRNLRFAADIPQKASEIRPDFGTSEVFFLSFRSFFWIRLQKSISSTSEVFFSTSKARVFVGRFASGYGLYLVGWHACGGSQKAVLSGRKHAVLLIPLPCTLLLSVASEMMSAPAVAAWPACR